MPILAYRTKIYCSPSASQYLFGAAGARRFAWNWYLAEARRSWAEDKVTLTGYDLVKKFNAIKKEQFPWIYEYSKWIPQNAAEALWEAQQEAFKGKKGFPKFKKKGKATPKFQVGGVALRVDKKNPLLLHLANCPHTLRISKPLRFPGKIQRATFTREADGWYVSLQIEVDASVEYPQTCKSNAACGIDLGITTSVTIADEDQVYKLDAPDTTKLETRLRRAQRSLARKQPASRNRAKARTKVALLYQKIRRVLEDFQHKVTATLVSWYRKIGLETLAVSNMMKNHKLARAIAGEGWGEFRRQITYKSALSGSNVVLADRFFPSSKTCSACDLKNAELKLSERTWTCPCGQIHDRDSNAAINLRKLAERYSESKNDCGGDVSPVAKASRHRRRAISDETVKRSVDPTS